MHFPYYQQPNAMDCSPTCLRMIGKPYRKNISQQQARVLPETTREVSSLQGLFEVSEKAGLHTMRVKTSRKNGMLKLKCHVPDEALKRQRSKIFAMSDWCMRVDNAYTTVYNNGKRLPETFNRSGVKDLIA